MSRQHTTGLRSGGPSVVHKISCPFSPFSRFSTAEERSCSSLRSCASGRVELHLLAAKPFRTRLVRSPRPEPLRTPSFRWPLRELGSMADILDRVKAALADATASGLARDRLVPLPVGLSRRAVPARSLRWRWFCYRLISAVRLNSGRNQPFHDFSSHASRGVHEPPVPLWRQTQISSSQVHMTSTSRCTAE